MPGLRLWSQISVGKNNHTQVRMQGGLIRDTCGVLLGGKEGGGGYIYEGGYNNSGGRGVYMCICADVCVVMGRGGEGRGGGKI